MEFNILEEDRINLRENFTKDILKEILILLELDGEISVYYVDSKKMKSLNKQYRNKDTDTDVLSFEFKGIMSQEYDVFGDIIISTDYAKTCAIEENLSYELKIAELLVHGVLHLAKYEHEGVDEKTASHMYKKQEDILKQIKILF